MRPPYVVREKLNVCSLVESSTGASIKDLDGNVTLDVSGSYGVNVCGYDEYKKWITAVRAVQIEHNSLPPVLKVLVF